MDLDQIEAWYRTKHQRTLPDGALLEYWHTLSSRCQFVKTMPSAGKLLDVGAGDGSLQNYRAWPWPPRADIRTYAFDMGYNDGFRKYEGFEVGTWPAQAPNFDGLLFDGIFSAHFIEHIPDPMNYIDWACGRLAPGGRIYLERPAPIAATLPTQCKLAERGIDIMIGNFFDDGTHQSAIPNSEAICNRMARNGLVIDIVGTLRVPFVADELLAYGRENDDIVARTLAYWSITGWCQHIIARRPITSSDS